MNRSHSWLHPDLEVRTIPGYGKGIFARKQIIKGKLLAIFGGYIMTLAEEQKLPEGMRDYAHQIAPNFVIGITKKEEIQSVDFFNHSCDPNAGFMGQIFLVSMKSIIENDQVTFDYAMVLSVGDYDIKCLCGSKKCRGRITGSDWKIPSVQKKYKGYFQPYLENIIKNKNQSLFNKHKG